MRFSWTCLSLHTVLPLLGCNDLQPQPNITAVQPDRAFSDNDVRLAVIGDHFVPATQLDPVSGRRIATTDGFRVRVGDGTLWTELTDLNWQSTGRLEALLPSGLAQQFTPGFLDVELTDRRGGQALWLKAFHELGADLGSPTITFTSPNTNPLPPLAAGMKLSGSFHASTAPPGALAGLRWRYIEYSEDGAPVLVDSSPCAVSDDPVEADCPFEFTVSESLSAGSTVQLKAEATELSIAAYSAQKDLTFSLVARPAVQSISPSYGGLAGGTDVVIKGSGFLPGSSATLDGLPLFPNGGIVVNPSTLTGYVPPHRFGSAALVVNTPIGPTTQSVAFLYQQPPLIQEIEPNTGAAAGGTPLAISGEYFSEQTQIYFGLTLDSAVPLRAPHFLSDTSIGGLSPFGTGQTTVWAFDAALGWTQLKNGFSWSPQ
jgi:hypothetical protein